jgi:hypothetical protein
LTLPDPLHLKVQEEAFGNSVVPAIAFPARCLSN